MFLGNYQPGDRLPLVVDVHHQGAVAVPDSAPVARVYTAAAATVADYVLPPLDPSNFPGFFGRPVHLDARFGVGQFAVRFAWTVGGLMRAAVKTFAVLPGGHPDGAAIAAYAFHMPQAEYLVLQLDSGKLFKGRNPTV